jgi:hypothetical protein
MDDEGSDDERVLGLDAFDERRPRWRQGLINWLVFFWPACRNVAATGDHCARLRWHRGEHRGW